MLSIDVSDVEYGNGTLPLMARVYRPSGPGPFPAAVSIHGGGWLQCDRTSNQALDAGLAQRGIMVFAIDFRMPPADPYPASIIDINYAIRWLKAHAGDFDTRPEWVGGVGTSSGGHQLLLSALEPEKGLYTSRKVEGSDLVDAQLAFMALCWPVVDPAARFEWARAREDKGMQDMQIAYFGDAATMSEADPLNIVEVGKDIHLPPAILIEGHDDDRLTPDGLDRFANAYQNRGGALKRHQFGGVGHTFIILDVHSEQSQQALNAISAFIHSRAKT